MKKVKVKNFSGCSTKWFNAIAEVIPAEKGGSNSDDGIIRVCLPEFWTRPDGMSPEEADDNTWLFVGEYEEI